MVFRSVRLCSFFSPSAEYSILFAFHCVFRFFSYFRSWISHDEKIPVPKPVPLYYPSPLCPHSSRNTYTLPTTTPSHSAHTNGWRIFNYCQNFLDFPEILFKVSLQLDQCCQWGVRNVLGGDTYQEIVHKYFLWECLWFNRIFHIGGYECLLRELWHLMIRSNIFKNKKNAVKDSLFQSCYMDTLDK